MEHTNASITPNVATKNILDVEKRYIYRETLTSNWSYVLKKKICALITQMRIHIQMHFRKIVANLVKLLNFIKGENSSGCRAVPIAVRATICNHGHSIAASGPINKARIWGQLPCIYRISTVVICVHRHRGGATPKQICHRSGVERVLVALDDQR